MPKDTCLKDGPLLLEGDFEILDANGATFDLRRRRKVLLCRCGQSKDKPFCDYSHLWAGFIADDCAARE